MLLRKFCLIREKTDFLWQKLWQLLSAEANFEGCIIKVTNMLISSESQVLSK